MTRATIIVDANNAEVLVMVCIHRRFERDPARQKRHGYTDERATNGCAIITARSVEQATDLDD